MQCFVPVRNLAGLDGTWCMGRAFTFDYDIMATKRDKSEDMHN